MPCRQPYMLGTQECPCGSCLPCRISRRRVWAHRILLESYKNDSSCFVTLTYDDEHVPDTLVKSDYQNWLKRLRKSFFPRKIRYFLAGEYGEDSGRPHFHAALFGMDSLTAGGVDGRSGLVKASWSSGYTFVGELTWESAQYIAGYLTKKLYGRSEGQKEFSRMSLRPAIGKTAVVDLARALSSDAGLDSIIARGDVPDSLRHGKRLLPLGKNMRRWLRGELGFADKAAPAEAQKMQVLQRAAELAETRKELASNGFKSWEIDRFVVDTRLQKIHNLEARFKARDSKEILR